MQTLDAPTFSLWLNPDPAAEPAGSLQLGGSNASLFRGELAPLQVISSKCAPVQAHPPPPTNMRRLAHLHAGASARNPEFLCMPQVLDGASHRRGSRQPQHLAAGQGGHPRQQQRAVPGHQEGLCAAGPGETTNVFITGHALKMMHAGLPSCHSLNDCMPSHPPGTISPTRTCKASEGCRCMRSISAARCSEHLQAKPSVRR